jgi:glycosyltransferase involved in cell wall biosynthesis
MTAPATAPPERRATPFTGARPRVVISINAAWNIANFRAGLIRALVDTGYEVVAVAPPDVHVARLEALGCRFVPLTMDNKGANPAADLALLARYYALLRRERPVAFLGYTIKPNVYGSLAAQALGIAVLNNISGLGTAFIRDSWLTRIVKQLYRTSLRRSHTVFFQNEDDRSLFVSQGLTRREQSEVLAGSGIDLVHFAADPRPAIRPPGVRRFLLVARLLRDKGILEYVEAARIVRRAYPQARFGILGFLDVENRTAITRTEIEGWVAEGVIEYLGVTDDVRPHLRDCDCVVLPSYREGTPRTLLEAAAMGKPLIATDVPGCRNVVDHGVNGLLCRVRDGADLAEASLTFLGLPDAKVLAMGRASRAKVEREYDERLVIDRYLVALTAVAGETRNRR